MLTIRLQRAGTKNKPEYRIVLAEKTAAVNKKFLEILGNYNPRNKSFTVRNEDRLKYWIGQHVEMSPTVHNLLVSKNLLDKAKIRAFSVPKKPVEEVAAPAAPVAPASETATEQAAPENTEQAVAEEAAPETQEA